MKEGIGVCVYCLASLPGQAGIFRVADYGNHVIREVDLLTLELNDKCETVPAADWGF
jgi:hypothetical protein